MFFCPICENSLKLKLNSLKCCVCEHESKINQTLSFKESFNVKINDGILKDESEYGNKCDVECPKCNYNRALFKEIQTRSADEPMTIFYRCLKCSYNWKV
ncbi:RPC10 [Hepatospora eriocheir]|uniref:RPC10 n=1 Tax=Hepatospora eriocheir TaxID=1081669 RepID=A0A1X0QIR1_9MICR|nr:RPC10 [Hepatospora eriocheir]